MPGRRFRPSSGCAPDRSFRPASPPPAPALCFGFKSMRMRLAVSCEGCSGALFSATMIAHLALRRGDEGDTHFAQFEPATRPALRMVYGGAWPFTWNRRGRGEQPTPGSRWRLWFARSKARLARSKARIACWGAACGDVYGASRRPEPRADCLRMPRTLEPAQRRLPSQLTRTCVVSLIAYTVENNLLWSSSLNILLIARRNQKPSRLEVVMLCYWVNFAIRLKRRSGPNKLS